MHELQADPTQAFGVWAAQHGKKYAEAPSSQVGFLSRHQQQQEGTPRQERFRMHSKIKCSLGQLTRM